MVQKGMETIEPKLTIRDPYIFEFLGLRAKDAMAETDLEAALLENLREFSCWSWVTASAWRIGRP